MTQTLPVALVQMRSGREVAGNVAIIGKLVRQAAAGGARYVQTPENSTVLDEDKARLLATTPPEAQSSALGAFRDLARELSIWLHIGSMPVAVGNGKLANRSLLISPKGEIAARYDKIHMFDVDLASGESFRESRTIEAGNQAVLADVDGAKFGLTVCYDLRFPALYRSLAQAGANILTVPSAFTQTTGAAHWQVLLRARAIENGAYVLAAAQGGTHENGRQTYGHSLIVGPDGDIVAEAGVDPGIVSAQLDLRKVDEYRQRIPSLVHDRTFAAPGKVAAMARNEAKT